MGPKWVFEHTVARGEEAGIFPATSCFFYTYPPRSHNRVHVTTCLMRITGTVVYQSFEGGFWGIQGDDHRNYELSAPLPATVRQANTRVEAEIEPLNVLSAKMWGLPVRILSIRPL